MERRSLFQHLKQREKSKKHQGECKVGEFVVPKQYKKLILNSDGTLKKVSGRKILNQEKGTREV